MLKKILQTLTYELLEIFRFRIGISGEKWEIKEHITLSLTSHQSNLCSSPKKKKINKNWSLHSNPPLHIHQRGDSAFVPTEVEVHNLLLIMRLENENDRSCLLLENTLLLFIVIRKNITQAEPLIALKRQKPQYWSIQYQSIYICAPANTCGKFGLIATLS